MTQYLLMTNPGHNRIYLGGSFEIAVSELSVISEAFDLALTDFGKGPNILPSSIIFCCEQELTEDQAQLLGISSAYYALFERLSDQLLRPIDVPEFRSFPESITQILKYTGKTNERFTRLMVNLAICACKTDHQKKVLFDPMCGKGTTLYEGMIHGFDVIGVEINPTWVKEIQTYLTRYLKEGRYKHEVKKVTATDKKGKKISQGFSLVTALNKQDYKNETFKRINVFHADTRIADQLVKNRSCDMIVCDLPYGVQHASKQKTDAERARSPYTLLKESLPSWYQCLKTKGSVVLSFNEYTLKYDDASQLIIQAGFTVLDDVIYTGYAHRVDQAINRNLIVAVK